VNVGWFKPASKPEPRIINLERCTIVVRLLDGKCLTHEEKGVFAGMWDDAPMYKTATDLAQDRIEQWGERGGVFLQETFIPMHQIRSIEITNVRKHKQEV